MSEWQPIETAPLDGTPVDLWAIRDSKFDREGRYTDCRFIRRTYGTEPFGEPVWNGLNDRYVKVTPTHWMPRPAPPTPSQEISS